MSSVLLLLQNDDPDPTWTNRWLCVFLGVWVLLAFAPDCLSSNTFACKAGETYGSSSNVKVSCDNLDETCKWEPAYKVIVILLWKRIPMLLQFWEVCNDYWSNDDEGWLLKGLPGSFFNRDTKLMQGFKKETAISLSLKHCWIFLLCITCIRSSDTLNA